jgi:hypothetical protein
MNMFNEPNEVVEEGRWSRTCRLDDGTVYVSKFLSDGLVVDLETIKAEWDTWSESERLDFVQAYLDKPDASAEDEKILLFLMERGGERVWANMASLLPWLSDRERALGFLCERLGSDSSEPKGGFVRALEVIGGTRALSALEEFHDVTRSDLSTVDGADAAGLIIDFMYCCSALVKVKGREPHLHEIEAFLSDERDLVRLVASDLVREANEKGEAGTPGT